MSLITVSSDSTPDKAKKIDNEYINLIIHYPDGRSQVMSALRFDHVLALIAEREGKYSSYVIIGVHT